MSSDELPQQEAQAYKTDLLLVLPVCLAQNADQLLFESQACNGMERWLENFSRIEVICPTLTGHEFREAHSTVWKPVSHIANTDRVQFTSLPYATTPRSFAWAFRAGRSAIRNAIGRSRYLCFAIGGLFGDWGAVACFEAQRLRRPYAIWTDRVEHQVVRMSSAHDSLLRRVKVRVKSRLMHWLERRCIRRSSLGLFHGASCYTEYSPWCRAPYLVQDFPSLETDAITDAQLKKKCSGLEKPCPLKLAYIGRADEMKGPFDWLDVMQLLHKRGVSFEATWLGDGALLAAMRSEVSRRNLSDLVSLPGFVANRDDVFGFLRSAHLFVFCHKTPESPRCLVESLLSGTPIVGYASDYAAELTEPGGGVLVAIGDKQRLAEEICALDSDRRRLIAQISAAVPAGKRINQMADFQYRSDLIKTHL